MRARLWWFVLGLMLSAISLSSPHSLWAQLSPAESSDAEEMWFEPIPTPFDPELEHQIEEVQDAMAAINTQIVRHKEQVRQEQDPGEKTRLYERLEALREEREDLKALLNDLVEEAKASQRTAIDEALRRARWLERQQESWERKEELLRDRQE